MARYTCPACHLFIARAVDGKCPHCKKPIKAVQVNNLKKGGLKTVYQIDEGVEVPRPEFKEEAPKDDWVIISVIGANPIVLLKISQKDGPKSYRVMWHSGQAPIGFVFCPSCNQKVIENMVIAAGTEIEQRAICRRCKSEVYLVIGRAALSQKEAKR